MSSKKIHITDWLPTILTAVDAPQEVKDEFSDIDGIDQYEMLFNDGPEQRNM